METLDQPAFVKFDPLGSRDDNNASRVREIFYKKPMAINRRSFVVRALAAASLPFTPVRCAAAVPPPVAAAGWVGTYLLEGALEYEGGQIMAGALGEPVLTDVRSWIDAG
jgi:hypothetical protein